MTHQKNRSSVPLKDQKIHLVYFIDSQKSQSIQCSLRSAIVCGTLAGIILVFALAGSVWSAKNMNRSRRLLSENRSLRKSLFEYQTRFDSAFATAYPAVSGLQSKSINSAIDEGNLPDAEENSQELEKNEHQVKSNTSEMAFVPAKNSAEIKAKASVTENDKTKSESKYSLNKNLSNAELPTRIKDTAAGQDAPQDLALKENVKATDAGKPADAVKTTDTVKNADAVITTDREKTAANEPATSTTKKESPSVSQTQTSSTEPIQVKSDKFPKISNSKVEMRGSNYRVSFELRSIAPNTLVSGKLWALAILDDGGKTVYRTYPAQINLYENGKIKSLHGAEKYRVSNFTVKFFNIDITSLEKATLKSIAIGVSNEKGEYTSYFVPITSISRDTTASPSGG